METEPLQCVFCSQPVLEALYVPVYVGAGVVGAVHLKCIRPLPRETPPVPPILTDEEVG